MPTTIRRGDSGVMKIRSSSPERSLLNLSPNITAETSHASPKITVTASNMSSARSGLTITVR